VLYIDSSQAKDLVLSWYSFDQAVAADFIQNWLGTKELQLGMKAEDGTSLDIRLQLRSSFASGMLNTTIKLTPSVIMRTRPMTALSGMLFNTMLGLGGVKIAGKTDLGYAYHTEADSIFVVKSGAGVFNEGEMGELVVPQSPRYIGKTRIADRPILSFGTVNIELPPTFSKQASAV
jgi:hypothetical protein